MTAIWSHAASRWAAVCHTCRVIGLAKNALFADAGGTMKGTRPGARRAMSRFGLLIPRSGTQMESVTLVMLVPAESPRTQYVSSDPWSFSRRRVSVKLGPYIPVVGGVGGIPSVRL